MSEAKCFHCGCTESNGCILGSFHGQIFTCSWVYTNPRRVCSARECVQKEIDLLFAEIDERREKAESAICS